MTPDFQLIEAIKNGTSEDIDQAIVRGANLDAKDIGGLSAIEVAERRGNLDAARKLLNAGADPDKVINKSGDYLLHRFAKVGDIGFTTLLLERGVDPDPINIAGKTPLHYAAIAGHQYLADRLIARGADVDAATPQGDTPLHLAAKQGHLPVVRSLLDPVAAAEQTTKNKIGYSPLHEAAAAGQAEVVEYLLQHGKRLDAGSRRSLLVGASRAAELHGHAVVTKMLIAAEASNHNSFAQRIAARTKKSRHDSNARVHR